MADSWEQGESGLFFPTVLDQVSRYERCPLFSVWHTHNSPARHKLPLVCVCACVCVRAHAPVWLPRRHALGKVRTGITVLLKTRRCEGAYADDILVHYVFVKKKMQNAQIKWFYILTVKTIKDIYIMNECLCVDSFLLLFCVPVSSRGQSAPWNWVVTGCDEGVSANLNISPNAVVLKLLFDLPSTTRSK